MEDAHISVSPLSDKKSSLFAVFDGHGGKSYTKD
jgi:serine/threonine protein phosphatase PrpC